MRLMTKALAVALAAAALSTLAASGPATALRLPKPNGPIACCPQ